MHLLTVAILCFDVKRSMRFLHRKPVVDLVDIEQTTGILISLFARLLDID
jgi:hypothetical protein